MLFLITNQNLPNMQARSLDTTVKAVYFIRVATPSQAVFKDFPSTLRASFLQEVS